MSGTTYKVGDLCDQIRGVTYAKADAAPNPAPGLKPVLRANNITDQGLHYQDLVYVPRDRISEKQYVKANDVVVAASSGSLDVVGKAARSHVDFDGGFGAFCKVLRPNAKVDPGYFAHFFQTQGYRRRVSTLAAGANINNLRNEHIDNLEIWLPTLAEQRRIAAILDKADVLRAKRREAIAKLDQLLQSVFLDMFGDPKKNAKRWPEAPLGELTKKIGSGATPKGGGESYVASGISFIRSLNVHDGVFKWDKLAFITEAQADKLKNVKVEADDVLLNITGASVARVCRAPASALPARVNQHVSIIRCGDKILPQYLEHLLMSRSMKSKLLSIGESGATRQAITKAEIAAFPVPVPSRDLQKKFAATVQQVEIQKTNLQLHSDRQDGLFASLQHRAFAGTL